MIEKRYQRYTRNGIEWTPWFPVSGSSMEKWQFGRKLKNEYRET